MRLDELSVLEEALNDIGPDYVANFSLVSRAETSAGVLTEILFK